MNQFLFLWFSHKTKSIGHLWAAQSSVSNLINNFSRKNLVLKKRFELTGDNYQIVTLLYAQAEQIE